MTNFIDLKHARIAHTAVGNGPDLLFIHGWPLDSRTYRHVVPALAKHFTCHLIDLPGTGKTIYTAQTEITLEGHCRTVSEIAAALNLSDYAIVAHDSGGVFARHLAANNPNQVRALVLSNTDIPRHHPSNVQTLVSLANLPGFPLLMRFLLRFRLFRLSSYFGKGMFYDLKRFEGEFGDLFIRPLYKDKAVLKGQMQLIYGWNWDFLDELTPLHGRIQAPVQLIWGKNDVIFPLNQARHMAKEFSSEAEFKVIKDSRLYVQEEQPEQFVAHVLPFLQSCFAQHRQTDSLHVAPNQQKKQTHALQ